MLYSDRSSSCKERRARAIPHMGVAEPRNQRSSNFPRASVSPPTHFSANAPSILQAIAGGAIMCCKARTPRPGASPTRPNTREQMRKELAMMSVSCPFHKTRHRHRHRTPGQTGDRIAFNATSGQQGKGKRFTMRSELSTCYLAS